MNSNHFHDLSLIDQCTEHLYSICTQSKIASYIHHALSCDGNLCQTSILNLNILLVYYRRLLAVIRYVTIKVSPLDIIRIFNYLCHIYFTSFNIHKTNIRINLSIKLILSFLSNLQNKCYVFYAQYVYSIS